MNDLIGMILLLLAGGATSFFYIKAKGREQVDKDQRKIDTKKMEVMSETSVMSDDDLDDAIERKLGGNSKYVDRK